MFLHSGLLPRLLLVSQVTDMAHWYVTSHGHQEQDLCLSRAILSTAACSSPVCPAGALAASRVTTLPWSLWQVRRGRWTSPIVQVTVGPLGPTTLSQGLSHTLLPSPLTFTSLQLDSIYSPLFSSFPHPSPGTHAQNTSLFSCQEQKCLW